MADQMPAPPAATGGEGEDERAWVPGSSMSPIVAGQVGDLKGARPISEAEVYGAGRIRRHRATRAEMEARKDSIFEIVAANQPTGIRFTYYTAVAKGIIPKTDNGYNKVQRAILEMRRSRRIPYSWIVDNTRWMRKPTTYGSLEEALRETAESYRRALWRDAKVAVEVWCESESVAGVLYPVTERWDVPLYPCKGQTSDSFAWGAAQQYRDDDRELLIFYFGDHDPAGYEIESNLHAKLAEHSGRDDIRWERLACTIHDVRDLGLIGSPPKKRTYNDAMMGGRMAFSGDAVEVEAIEPPTLRRWLDNMIRQQVDQDALGVLEYAEEAEREILTRLADTARGA
jgi:hypothetical protein